MAALVTAGWVRSPSSSNTVPGRRILAAKPLDHDGCPTGKTVPVSDHEFMLDTSRDRTPYYELLVE